MATQTTNSVLAQNSRYVQGGITEKNSTALEWWERTTFALDETDTKYTIDTKSAGRLDLIAEAFLGDSHLWWFIAQYNAILDPYSEVIPGRILRIPQKSRVQTLLVGKTGGIASAREVKTSRITPII